MTLKNMIKKFTSGKLKWQKYKYTYTSLCTYVHATFVVGFLKNFGTGNTKPLSVYFKFIYIYIKMNI